MATDVKGQPYLMGKFTGLFKQSNKKHNGDFVFSEMHWTYLRIEDYKKIDNFDAASQKTGDYLFAETIFSTNGSNPFRKKTDVFIPHGPEAFYSGDLHNVLIKNLKINHSKSYFLQKDWHEASGDIFFQLTLPPKVEKTLAPKVDNQVSGTNILGNPIIKSDPVTIIATSSAGNTNIAGTNILTPVNSGNSSTPISTAQSAGNWSKWIGWLFELIIYGLIGYYLWTHFRTIAYIFFVILLLNLIGRVFRKFGFLRVLGIFAVLGFIGYYLFANLRGGIPDDMNPVKTRDGKVKVSPPKRTNDTKDGNPDYATEKEIQWFDFSNQSYLAKYLTSQASFENSVKNQDQLAGSITNVNSSTEYYTQLYKGLFSMDEEKISQVAKIFSDSAANKKMDPLQTAEMVVTFIQEIPYYLVHEENCEKAIASGNEFLQDYHREGKPCLPNVSGGVQSPYEFLHNLKGDCDTRSLLGHAILSKLNIVSSVWVSNVYGHSILGVAVPVGHGMYKEVEGVKHYAVELTAKGFRLGMVSPEQARPNNWEITLYNNHL